MKLSANIMAYVVLIAAVVLVGVYVTGVDTSTNVNTAEESLLPNVYPPEGQAITPDVQGVSFRYPAGWQVTGSGDTLTMSRPVDRFDDTAGQYTFTIQVSQQAGDTPLTPADLVPADIGDAQVTELQRDGLPAVRTVKTEPDGNLTITDYVQLSDQNVFWQMSNKDPISEATWNKLSPDVDRTLNSIKADNVTVVQDVFVYTLPDNWEAPPSQQRFVATLFTPNSQSPSAVMQFIAMPPALLQSVMARLLPTGSTPIDLTIADNPLTALELYVQVPDLPITITEDLHDVSYFGHDGKEFTATSDQMGLLRYAIVDMGDGIYAQVAVNVVSGNSLDDYIDDINAILDSVQYTAPNPSMFQP